MRHLRYAVILCLIVAADSLFAQDPRIEPQYVWQDYGARNDWTNHIAFDYMDEDGFFDLGVCNFNRTYQRRITKDVPNFPQRHNGNPTCHPNRRYIIFQAQKDSSLGGDENRAWFTYAVDSYKGSPGKGLDNDLWCVDLYDMSFYRLTTLPTKKSLFDTTKVSGILHPHFSSDGARVLWAQGFNVQADIGNRGTWGLWQVNISDFVIDGGVPSLQNTISYRPGGILGDFTWCETHGWTQSDSVVIFSMNAEGQHQTHMDIYTLNIYDSTLVRLTDDPLVWDEHAHVSPDGRLVYMSSEPYDFDPTRPEETLKTDFWIMDMDGGNKQRLTFFNDPTHPDHQIHGGQRIICGDASFSPTGDSILIDTKLPDNPNEIYDKIMLALYTPASTGIEIPQRIPEKIVLYQNYPNPFNATTKINYSILKPSFVALKIYDTLGREMQTLVSEFQEADTYSVILDSHELASGIYFYELKAGTSVVETKRMLLLR